MEQERYMVFDNQKGILVPLSGKSTPAQAVEKAEKAAKLKALLQGLIQETVKECAGTLRQDMKEELIREFKKEVLEEVAFQMEQGREEIKQMERQRLEDMDRHFQELDMILRRKQYGSKRKRR